MEPLHHLNPNHHYIMVNIPDHKVDLVYHHLVICHHMMSMVNNNHHLVHHPLVILYRLHNNLYQLLLPLGHHQVQLVLPNQRLQINHHQLSQQLVKINLNLMLMIIKLIRANGVLRPFEKLFNFNTCII